MITNNDASYILTDPLDIERIATTHFQSSAGISPINVKIPVIWSEEFNPKDHINAEIYIDLMNSITKSEFSQIISSLPTNKASDPSTITYKAVKHAGSLCHTIIMKLLNAYL